MQYENMMNPSASSDFYLERVGFEVKVSFRHNLKGGENLVGRSDTHGVHIGINSMLCSRRHCVLSVTDDGVSLEDLRSSNGTTINGRKIQGEKLSLNDGDLIGIIGGGNALSDLIGNHNFIVYRLCRYTAENVRTFEVEDDDAPIELLSDDDEDNEVICLDSDGESIDIKEELDLEILLSRNFNTEIKKELEDLDFLDDMQLKSEPLDYDFDEYIDYAQTDHDMNGNVNNETEFNPEPLGRSGGRGDEDNQIEIKKEQTAGNLDQNVSLHEESFDGDDHQCNDFPGTSGLESSTPSTDHANFSITRTEKGDLDLKFQSKKGDWELKFNSKKGDLDLKLKKTVSKITNFEEKHRKRVSEVIDPKPLEKRRRKNKVGASGCPKAISKDERKNKLKIVASASKSETPNEEKVVSTHTTPKVKFTPNNRGSFLAEMPQLPPLARVTQPQQKTKEQTNVSKINNVPNEQLPLAAIPTPPELEQKICEKMNGSAPQIHLLMPKIKNSNTTPTKSSDSVCVVIPGLDTSIDLPGPSTDNNDTGADFDDDDDDDDETEIDKRPESHEIVKNENDIGENDDDDDDGEDDDDDDDDYDEDTLLKILSKLPPENAKIRVIENNPKPANIKSILKVRQSPYEPSDGSTKTHRVSFKENGFQHDPRHKIVSDITAYDYAQHESVDAYCRTVDKNVSSFADSYEEYEDYQKALISLMKVELWKEIELEYINSKSHSFTTVTINDQNREKRGAGRRMVFHCQANSLYNSQAICDGHLVFVKGECNKIEFQFVAYVNTISFSKKQCEKLAYFTMETSALTEVLPITSLQIRPITVITNTLNNFNAIHNLKHSPLSSLIVDPLSANIPSLPVESVAFKTYDPLDDTQRRILGALYRRSINLEVPNISLVDGAAGSGKTCMIANLALQLVYGNDLPKPLRILICSKTNGSINNLARKLISIRDNTTVTTKIQLVRFGMLESMDDIVKRVSVQHLKDGEVKSQFASYEGLVRQKTMLELKLSALNLDSSLDQSSSVASVRKQLFKVNALLSRFEGVEKKKLRDTATFILNSCDIICTTLSSIPKLQNYISKIDVCIIDEATECIEPLTLLTTQFGMPSLVLVGDSQLIPHAPYSSEVKTKNYGNSLFARFHKLYLGRFGSPVYEMHFQYRMHKEILVWPNYQFYKNRLVTHTTVNYGNFPIVPFKVISYGTNDSIAESDNVAMIMKVLMARVESEPCSFGIICPDLKQNYLMKSKWRDYKSVTTNVAESYMDEKDVVIIWISEEYGLRSLAHQQILNIAVTRAKKSLVICGANLDFYKNRPTFKSLLSNALSRKCFHKFKMLTVPKLKGVLIQKK